MELDFSFFKPKRGAQWKALAKLATLDDKYVLLSAPVGSGKSYIGMAAARGAGSAFIVSPQNILLEQYASEFKDVPMVKGMSKYSCGWAMGMSCEEASDQSPDEHARRCHDYIPARNAFWENPISVTNLHYLMFAHPPKGAIAHRDLLVVDECHGLEPMLLSLFHAKVLRKDCVALGILFDRPDLSRLFRDYIAQAKRVRAEEGSFRSPEIQIQYPEQRKRIHSTAKKLERVDLSDKQNWHTNREAASIECRPLFARNLAQRLLGLADRVLFMSATPGSAKHFFDNLGITKDTASAEVDSDFPRGKGILLAKDALYLSQKNLEANISRLAKACAHIMEQPDVRNEKGLIACASHDLAQKLFDRIRRESPNAGDRLLKHDATNREGVVAEHRCSKKPTVLLGVNMHEGLDLRDDLGRFLIIPKVLYTPRDAWVEKREQLDPGYYDRLTAARMVQACGRVIRGPEDWAYIVLFDATMQRLKERVPDEFPGYFHRAFHIGDYVD